MMRGKQPLPKEEETEAESESPPEQSGTKSQKTRTQKDKHNESCRRSRQNIKEKRKKLEEEIPKLQAENKKAKMKLEEFESKSREKDIEIQRLKRNLEAKKANDQQSERRILTRLTVDGQSFTSFDELEKWLTSKDYVEEGQVSGTSGNVLHDGNGFVGLGAIGTANLAPSMADLYQQMVLGQDYANITASAVFGPSVANHGLQILAHTPGKGCSNIAASAAYDSSSVANPGSPFVSDTPSSYHGQGYNSTTASAAPGSSVPNDGLTFVYDIPTSYHGPPSSDNTNITASVVAGSSSIANHGLPVVFDTPSSHHGQEHTNITASAAGSFVSDTLSSHGAPTVPDSSLGANFEMVSALPSSLDLGSLGLDHLDFPIPLDLDSLGLDLDLPIPLDPDSSSLWRWS